MKIIKSILAIIAGIVAGSIINAGIILICNLIFGIPEGMVPWDEESVKAHADKLSIANLIGTLAAHQLGTLTGAFTTMKIAPIRKMIFPVVIGLWFLAGGIYAASLIKPPTWFSVTDILLYLPIAIIGGKLGGVQNKKINRPQ